MTPLTITLPLPDRHLTLNGRLHWRVKARLVKQHREWAEMKARSLIQQRPHFPAGAKVRVDVRIERKKYGQKWDSTAIIEATKSYIDGFQDAGVYLNDSCVRWGEVEWDAKPTGKGIIVMSLSEVEGWGCDYSDS